MSAYFAQPRHFIILSSGKGFGKYTEMHCTSSAWWWLHLSIKTKQWLFSFADIFFCSSSAFLHRMYTHRGRYTCVCDRLFNPPAAWAATFRLRGWFILSKGYHIGLCTQAIEQDEEKAGSSNCKQCACVLIHPSWLKTNTVEIYSIMYHWRVMSTDQALFNLHCLLILLFSTQLVQSEIHPHPPTNTEVQNKMTLVI